MNTEPRASAPEMNGRGWSVLDGTYTPLAEQDPTQAAALKDQLIINSDSYRYFPAGSGGRFKMQGMELARQALHLAHPEQLQDPVQDAQLRTTLQELLLEAYESTGLKDLVYDAGLHRFPARYALMDLINLSNEIAAHADDTESPKLARQLAVEPETADVARNILRLLVLKTSAEA